MFMKRPTSKFRHMFGKSNKAEDCYNGVRLSRSSMDGNFCHVNPKFIALITEAGAGASFMVLPIEKTGRIDINMPLVGGHTGAVLDVKWNPFDDNTIASASEDCTARVWYIPDGGLTDNLENAIVTLKGHQRKVTHVLWHPCAENILLTAAQDKTIYIWNLHQPDQPVLEFSFPDVVQSVSFNYNGSKIVATFKDRFCRVMDLRSGEMTHEWRPHESGSKPSQCLFLKDGRVFTTGFGKMSERLYALWDLDKLDEPLDQNDLDTSNGVVFPFYDVDIDIIYLSGKGDSTIRFYEQQDTTILYLNSWSSKDGTRGVAFMPKRGLDFSKNEIARVFKLHANKGFCEVISFTVPRVADNFQDDLYPDTLAPRPALSAAEWITGQNKDPVLMSVRELFEAQSEPCTTQSSGQALKDRLQSQIASSLGPTTRRPSAGSGESATAHPVERRGSTHKDRDDQMNSATQRASTGAGSGGMISATNGSASADSVSTAAVEALLAPVKKEIETLKRDYNAIKSENDKLRSNGATQADAIKKLRQKVKVLEAKVSILEASTGNIQLDDSDDGDDALV